MNTVDEVFYREFNELMSTLKASCPSIRLADIPLPHEFKKVSTKQTHIEGIECDYFDKLNDTTAVVYAEPLRRRKFDYLGEFMKGSDGNYIYDSVAKPADSVSILSPVNIEIPYKAEKPEGFDYVDYLEAGDKKLFIYIIPKNVCYKLNCTALVLSWAKQSRFYTGIKVATAYGRYLYLQVIPHNITRVSTQYRIIASKYGDDYTSELQELRDYWIPNKIMFNPEDYNLICEVRGITNLAIIELDSSLPSFELYNLDSNMGEPEVDVYFGEALGSGESDDNTSF